MANQLTGEYDAVFQIAISQMNALLGALHENGGRPAEPLKLPHSVRLSLGRRRRRPSEVGEFSEWLSELHRAQPTVPISHVRGALLDATPPGAAVRMRDALAAFDDVVADPHPPDLIRGRADVQISTVTITLPEGSTSEVTIHADVRADYRPAPQTSNLPAPIHGEVEATFEIRRVRSGDRHRLIIEPSADDAKIRFQPAPGTISAGEASAIAAEVRHALRDLFTLTPVEIPSEFPFGEFKGVGAGAAGAAEIALGIQLRSATVPSGGLAVVTESLVGPAGLAFALSKEFLTTIFKPAIDSLLQFQQDVPVSEHISPFHVSVSSAGVEFNTGSIDLWINAKAVHPRFPDVAVSIRQRITLLVLLDSIFIIASDDNDALTISPSAAGIPLPSGLFRGRVIAARNEALVPAQEALHAQLAEAKTRFTEALRRFDPAAELRLRAGRSEDPGAATSGAIAITPDGVIVRGDLRWPNRAAAVVDVRETDDETAFTAVDSWIPAGRVERFFWSWVEYGGDSVLSGHAKSLPPEEHRFVLPKRPGVTSRSQVCLRIEGTVIGPMGTLVPAAGGTTCRTPVPDTMINAPSWWEPVTVPVWQPGLDEANVARDAIAAHVSLQADTAGKERLTHNSLIYFIDWQSEKPLATLSEALKQLRRRGVSLMLFVVVPAGAFDGRRRDLESKLGSIGAPWAANLQVTEDDQGGWTKTFAPSTRPAAFLMNARRQFVWKQEGALEPRQLAAALDQHLDVAPSPRFVALHLAIAPGDSIVDAVYEDERGGSAALHRLRGQRLVLNFFQAWSTPCRRELRRLQAMHDRKTRERLTIVAFHGGVKDDLERVRTELGLTITLVQDAEQQVARSYGVRCWPTTVLVGAAGIVEHVQFGVPPSLAGDVEVVAMP